MDLSENELILIQDALFAYLHSLDATGPVFDWDSNAALDLLDRVHSHIDGRLIAAGIDPAGL